MSKRWAAVCRLGGIGDDLVAVSPCRPLKKLGYNVEFITSGMAQSVLLNNPFIDKLSVKNEGDIPGGQNNEWQKWFSARSNEYDLLVNLSNSMETRHAKHQNDTAFWWPQDYRRKVCAGSYLETAHDIVGVPYDFGPLFFPTDEEKERAQKTKKDNIGDRYVAWVIAGSRVDKVWPFTAHAICRIISELNIPVVMIGVGGKQYEMAKGVMDDVRRSNSTVKDLHLAMSPDGTSPEGDGHQHWSIRRSLTQALAADVVVSPDTGTAWACAMEPMPKVILHSHASVENITKHWKRTISLHADQFAIPCWPCNRLHDTMETCVPCKDNPNSAACIGDIPVELLVTSISAALGSKSSSDRLLKEWPSRVVLQDFPIKPELRVVA